MKLKKILIIFMVFFMSFVINTTNSYASTFNNWNFDVQLNDDGSMDVVETWDIYISEVNTLYKTFKLDKSKFSNITGVKVEEIKSGISYPLYKSEKWAYHLNKNEYFGGINNDGDFEICWGVGLDNSSATRTYVISYTVNDVVKKYGDCAEIYWKFIGENFEIGAKNVTGKIKLPTSVENKDDIKVWGHTEYLNGEIYVTDTDTVTFTVDNYKAKKFVEVRILAPTDIFPKVAYTSNLNKIDEIVEEETKWAEEANAKREQRDAQIKMGSIFGCIIIFVIGSLFIGKIKKYNQELEETPKIIPQMKLDYYRELPDETATPVEADYIMTRTNSISKTLSATILNLTLKGALNAEQDNKNVIFEITDKKIALEKDERQVLELLKKSYQEKNKKIKKKTTN